MSRAFRRVPLILAMAAMLPFASSTAAVAGSNVISGANCTNSTLETDAVAGGTWLLDCGSISITNEITVSGSVEFDAGTGYTPTLSPVANTSDFAIGANGDLTLKGVTLSGGSGMTAIVDSGLLSASSSPARNSP